MVQSHIDHDDQVYLLAAQYLQLLEPQHLSIPPNDVLIRPAVQQLIYQSMFDEKHVWPIPPPGYRTRVLKILISKLEESISNPEEDEVLDDLMTSYSDLISLPRQAPVEEAQAFACIRYTSPRGLDPRGCRYNDQYIITSEKRNLVFASGTTGFRTWEAALHLGTYLSTPAGRSLIEGKKIIELGSGTGFLSMYCLKYLGARSVTATDRDPALISGIKDCAILNDLSCSKINAGIWEWGTPLKPGQLSLSGKSDQLFDAVLGADLIYDPDLVSLLLSTLRDLFDNHGVKVFIMSCTHRNPETFNAFLNAC
ncbi:hypothetical protein ACJ72_04642, partial [Emergomyces africanus]